MTIAYYYNAWDDAQTRVQIEEVADGCDSREINEVLSAYLALKGISVHEWAIEEITSEQLMNESIYDMLNHGGILIREQND